jgi:hypothetical protein
MSPKQKPKKNKDQNHAKSNHIPKQSRCDKFNEKAGSIAKRQ